MRFLAPLLAVLAAAGAIAVVLQALLRAQTGPLPLVSVFELHVLVVATVLALVALVGSLGAGRRRAWTRLAMAAVIVLAVVRAGGELWSPEAPEGASSETELTVLSWNLEMDSKSPADAAAGIAAIDADVVSLQELTPAFAAGIEADGTLKARYPYRILEPRPGPNGLGLLAKRPLIVRGLDPGGRILRAGLLLDDGRTVELLDVHPTRPLYTLWGPLPVSLDTQARDEDVVRIAEIVGALDDPAAAVVAGDLNGTSSEAGLGVLDGHLVDAHAAVGTGPGFTWRPDQLEGLDTGVLRIDHVLVGAWSTPVFTSVDCTATGDHCRLLVTLRVTPPAP
jgi:endonuclease/exonuclease/phosphatase (EEP) superfamily protein YafD